MIPNTCINVLLMLFLHILESFRKEKISKESTQLRRMRMLQLRLINQQSICVTRYDD